MPKTMTNKELERAGEQLTTRAMAVRADSIDEETRSVEAVIATEAPVRVFDMRRFELIEEVLRADGAELPSQTVLLENHNRFSLDNVIGSVRNYRREGDQIVGRLFFAKGDEIADRAWNKVRQGHLTDVSAAYRVERWDDLSPNETRTVKGKSYTAGNRGLRVSTKWKPRETSVVPIGADEATKMRAEMQRNLTQNEGQRARNMEDMKMTDEEKKLKEAEEKKRTEAEALEAKTSPTDPVEIPVTRQAASDAPAPVIDIETVRKEAVEIVRQESEIERKRVADIHDMAGDDVPEDIVRKAIDEKWSPERTSREYLKAIREVRPASVAPGVAIHSRSHEKDCTVDAIGAGMLYRAGLELPNPRKSDEVKTRNDQLMEQGQVYLDLSMIDICREACRLDGLSTPHNRRELIKRAVSTSALTAIFSTVVGAQLIKSFTEAPDSTLGWTSEAEVNNFQTKEIIRLGKMAGLDRLARGDSAAHASISDNKEQYKIARYARKFVVDEMDIIDDRFGALLTIPIEMGMAAGRLRADLVYSILLENPNMRDSTALFHSNHSNTFDTNALTNSTLQAALTKMAKQTEDGVNLNLQAKTVIIPQDLFYTLEIILKSAERIIASSSGGTYNPLLASGLQVAVDNRVGAAGVTDPRDDTKRVGLTTNYWLVADKAMAPTFEVGFLRGTGRAPQFDSWVENRGTWGIGFAVKHDIGAKPVAWEGIQYNKGAS